jgi:chemotaxis receptor (MCP) glutamine deamidase CheD
MFITAEHVGGAAPRTMLLNVADGAVAIKCNDECVTI